jgi:glucan endo-1,3-beta-D-glucosidase
MLQVNWLGHNSFPYYESTRPNSIDQARENLYSGIGQTESVSDGKPVWVTETGWPRFGPQSGAAVASVENAQRYWKDVGCSLFASRNTFWYTLKDANVAQTDLSFALTPLENNTPFFDLTC